MTIKSFTKLPTYEISGNFLNIYYDEQPFTDEETGEQGWTYEVVRARTTDSYAALVVKIIRSRYSVDDELAAINSSGARLAEFKAFRQVAKQLALKSPGDIPPPSVVSMRQGRLALLAAGLLDQIDDAIAAIPDANKRKAVQIEWEYAQQIDRESPLVRTFADQLNMSEDDLDELFRQAYKL